MYNYQKGTKINSLCVFCEKRVISTFTNETLSLCNGLEEVENVLVRVCDECGNIASIPHRSVAPIQQVMKKLVESGAVSDVGEITTELKSHVDARGVRDPRSNSDYKYEPIAAAG